jgi:hypothetical protein
MDVKPLGHGGQEQGLKEHDALKKTILDIIDHDRVSRRCFNH